MTLQDTLQNGTKPGLNLDRLGLGLLAAVLIAAPLLLSNAYQLNVLVLMVVNAVLGGPAEHPFWERINEILPAFYADRPGDEMNKTTGPHLLTAMARGWNRNRAGDDEFLALPQVSFCAAHWKQIPEGGDAAGLVDWKADPNVIGIHHWGHRKVGRTNYVETATPGVRA